MSEAKQVQPTYREHLEKVITALSLVQRTARGTNAGLWLDRYIVNPDRSEPQQKTLIDQVAAIPVHDDYQAFYQRWEQMLKSHTIKPRKAQVKGRMIVGLGNESVLETGVALHRTYGVPYIPGSALKGLAAHYAQQRLSGDDGPWKKDKEGYKVVFGNTDEAGYITFFDALYIPDSAPGNRPLVSDVITVHHPLYYRNNPGATPSDWDSPTPIPFLSTSGCYLIALAAPEIDKKVRQQWIKTAFGILERALAEYGIGAKTSSGYGRMHLLPPDVDPEIQKAEGYIRELNRLTSTTIAGQIQSYFQRWQRLRSPEARVLLARAIVDKVRQTGTEGKYAGQQWYRELVKGLDEDSQE